MDIKRFKELWRLPTEDQQNNRLKEITKLLEYFKEYSKSTVDDITGAVAKAEGFKKPTMKEFITAQQFDTSKPATSLTQSIAADSKKPIRIPNVFRSFFGEGRLLNRWFQVLSRQKKI